MVRLLSIEGNKMKTGIKLTSLSTWDNSKPHGLNASEWISTGHTSVYDGVRYAEFSNRQGSLQDWPIDDAEIIRPGNYTHNR